MVDWTAGRIAALPLEGLKNLRANAAARSNQEVMDLCDAEIAARAAHRRKIRSFPDTTESQRGQYVGGYHFVCPTEKGVTFHDGRTVWTGTWVVDKRNAEMSTRYGAYVALHATKSEPSYLQGTLKDWRKAKRNREYADGRPVRIPFGIDMLVERTDQKYDWIGTQQVKRAISG